MVIREIRCEQFAGIRDMDIRFGDGLNLLIGDNESGKSTIIELIYNMLFRNVRLDGRKDGDFTDSYFPNIIDKPRGDVIDGTIIIITDAGEYKLRKEWDSQGGVCRLTVPGGTSYKSMDTISAILDEELVYGAGVYGELIIPSQKRPDYAIQSIMSELKGKKEDILVSTRNSLTSVFNRAALETGGVSIDVLRDMINEKLSLYGSHWDEERNMPEGGIRRGINNPWKREVGLILEAYYDMENVKLMQDRAVQAEKNIDIYKKNIQLLNEERRQTEEEKVLFHKYIGIIEQISLLRNNICEQEKRLKECEAAAEKWPEINKKIKMASELRIARENVIIHKRYNKACNVKKNYDAAVNSLEKMIRIDESDIRLLEKKQNELRQLKGMLKGMKLTAKVVKKGDKDIEIRSIADNKLLNEGTGELQIDEAIVVDVKDVMELKLMPGGVDIDELSNNIKKTGSLIEEIYNRYDVCSLEELREHANDYNKTVQEADRYREELAGILVNDSMESLRDACNGLPDVTDKEEDIICRIEELCGEMSLERYIGRLESVREVYEDKFKSFDTLTGMINTIRYDIEANNNKITTLGDIPDIYREIESPGEYEAGLNDIITDIESRMNEFDKLRIVAERELGDKSAEDYEEDYNEKKELYDTRIKEYDRWRHISNVFLSICSLTVDNPTGDIAQYFQEYLEIISSSGITVSSVDDKIGVKIASGNHLITYDTLSAGTKDTVALAFRLAMLRYLYPEGGCFAVFDDPFTDMDPDRTKAACTLISQFAKNNQVIFTTCDTRYTELMENAAIIKI